MVKQTQVVATKTVVDDMKDDWLELARQETASTELCGPESRLRFESSTTMDSGFPSRAASGCESDSGGMPELIQAAKQGDVETVSDLLDQNCAPDCQDPCSGWTPLMFAAAAGKAQCVKKLLSFGADANHVARPHDWTALTAAILSNQEEVVCMLLDAGADLKSLRRRHPMFAEAYAQAEECYKMKKMACRCPEDWCQEKHVSNYYLYV
eukprot:TRINITY_DN20018_c0_g1_i2.p1 TRINITY_DN20018_c0_g1~~TRINITY_DN20018_c0_g1_i2.p1  ORF type:complete len:209 (+),score=46.15 TRINITY_DN20018_c0_g1_i2:121-747(+)